MAFSRVPMENPEHASIEKGGDHEGRGSNRGFGDCGGLCRLLAAGRRPGAARRKGEGHRKNRLLSGLSLVQRWHVPRADAVGDHR